MKKAILVVLVAAVAVLTGCNYDTDDTASPGYTMHYQATWSNELAVDGINIAIRFAKLMAEVDATAGATLSEDTDDNWALLGDFTYPYNNSPYNKKEFLLGTTNDLTITESESVSGEYTLNYWIKSGTLKGEMSSAWFDNLKRRGAYVITTNNLPLTETTESTPWEITICNDGSYDPDNYDENEDDDDDEEEYDIEYEDYMTFDDDDIMINITEYTAKIWYAGGGKFAFSADATIKLYYETYDWTEISNWVIDTASMEFTNYSDLRVESCINNDVEMTYNTVGGTSIYGYTLTYCTTSPLIYNYAKSPYTCYGGIESITIYGESKYDFPETNAIVETWSNGLRTVYYNDETYTW